MAQLGERPFPPGRYPVVVVGSGAGGLQMAYSLGRLGVRHAAISGDDRPAGMFRRFPFFQRLISWTKPYAPAERGTREYQKYDWNSLVADDPKHNGLVAEFMDGTSYFPSRAEMQRGIEAFAERAEVTFRYGCRWEGTRREDGALVIETSDGDYRCEVAVFAIGMTEPWKPDIPGLEAVPHYVDCDQPDAYADRRVFIIGKRNSGFELADGLLPWARELILASPRPARISVLTHSVAAARARYMQPYEEHVLGGGTLVLDAAIGRVEGAGDGYRVYAKATADGAELVFEVDRVIAATGFGTPLGDLPQLGVATFFQSRLPAQTAWWESASVPGVFFAGSVTQGAIGLKKYGRPSSSAAVHGFRYNAVVLARHLARTRFGIEEEPRRLDPDDVVPYLLREATNGPELFHQQAYLARVVAFDPDRGIVDQGVLPLADFVDSGGPDAVAMTVETNEEGVIRPCAYVRRGGAVEERILPPHQLHRFDGEEHRAELRATLKGLLD